MKIDTKTPIGVQIERANTKHYTFWKGKGHNNITAVRAKYGSQRDFANVKIGIAELPVLQRVLSSAA